MSNIRGSISRAVTSPYAEDGSLSAPPESFDVALEISAGISLRDYFAAHAIVGFLACVPGTHNSPANAAREAYDYADAMLKAREGDGRS